eukprot:TRINITY_DN21242_c0_g1_i1.p1 TRINITY_DN21242_c0_g1~~TRINITY_DN21242_c0_g1_i1.p1  ORF type:complete len:760 (-),score=116.29 TRINITY_DN21242_c0_g1_i1:145-2424(-)
MDSSTSRWRAQLRSRKQASPQKASLNLCVICSGPKRRCGLCPRHRVMEIAQPCLERSQGRESAEATPLASKENEDPILLPPSPYQEDKENIVDVPNLNSEDKVPDSPARSMSAALSPRSSSFNIANGGSPRKGSKGSPSRLSGSPRLSRGGSPRHVAEEHKGCILSPPKSSALQLPEESDAAGELNIISPVFSSASAASTTAAPDFRNTEGWAEMKRFLHQQVQALRKEVETICKTPQSGESTFLWPSGTGARDSASSSQAGSRKQHQQPSKENGQRDEQPSVSSAAGGVTPRLEALVDDVTMRMESLLGAVNAVDQSQENMQEDLQSPPSASESSKVSSLCSNSALLAAAPAGEFFSLMRSRAQALHVDEKLQERDRRMSSQEQEIDTLRGRLQELEAALAEERSKNAGMRNEVSALRQSVCSVEQSLDSSRLFERSPARGLLRSPPSKESPPPSSLKQQVAAAPVSSPCRTQAHSIAVRLLADLEAAACVGLAPPVTLQRVGAPSLPGSGRQPAQKAAAPASVAASPQPASGSSIAPACTPSASHRQLLSHAPASPPLQHRKVPAAAISMGPFGSGRPTPARCREPLQHASHMPPFAATPSAVVAKPEEVKRLVSASGGARSPSPPSRAQSRILASPTPMQRSGARSPRPHATSPMVARPGLAVAWPEQQVPMATASPNAKVVLAQASPAQSRASSPRVHSVTTRSFARTLSCSSSTEVLLKTETGHLPNGRRIVRSHWRRVHQSPLSPGFRVVRSP